MKRASLIAVTLVVVAILALGWWITRRGSRSAATVVALPAQSGIAAESSALTEAQSLHGVTARGVIPTAIVGEPCSEATAGRRILVVDAGSNTLVPGAEVRWTDSLPVFEDPEHPLAQFDSERFFEAAEPGLRTDAGGSVTLPVAAKPLFVWARVDDRFGSTRVYRSASPEEQDAQDIRVTIDHGVHLDIQVVDTNEQPVSGVPVSIRATDKFVGSEPKWTGITDAGGIAHVRHLERAFANLQPPSALFAGFEFPTRTARAMPVDKARLPNTPLRLVLPDCGSVEVRVHGTSTTPLIPEGVQLIVSKPEFETFVTAMPRLGVGECKPAQVEAGRAFFPFVETGLELTAWLTYETKPFRHTGHGPERSGERVTFDVDVGMQRPRLAGRLVDSNRSPLAEVEAEYALSTGSMSTSTTLHTDAFGRFTLTVQTDAEQRFDGTLGFKKIKGRSEGEAAVIDLNRVLRAGVNEIGDVIVRAPAVIATVHLVDEDGKRLARDPSFYIEVESVRDGVAAWVHSWEIRTQPGPGDAFEIRSCGQPKRMRLRVSVGDYMQLEPCVIDPAVPDVRVVMLKASEVSGRVLIDDGLDARLLQVFLRGQDDAPGAVAVPAERTRAQADGTFRIVRARARLADLVVEWPGWKEPLVVLRDLDLRGVRGRDPRLDEIDLRGRDMRTGR